MSLNVGSTLTAETKEKLFTLVNSGMQGYNTSLKEIYTWLNSIDTYDRYCNDKKFREMIKFTYLTNSMFDTLNESKKESIVDKDFMFHEGKDGILFPWFSIIGVKKFCKLQFTDESNAIYKYLTKIEKDHYAEKGKKFEKVHAEFEKYL
jgi:hypothetical protein